MTDGAPAVFIGLTQAALDRAYDQAAWVPNAAELENRIATRGAAVMRSMPPRTCRYGNGDAQSVEIFAPAAPWRAPVLILIHGGAWRLSMRHAFCGAAPAIVEAGCIFAIVGFDCIPSVRLPEMAAQIGDAIRWIGKEIAAFGGDPANLHIAGHSSGAHLAAVMMAENLPGVRGATLVSGLYDLEPVMLSSRGRYLELTRDETEALSPIRHTGNIAAPVAVWWSDGDSPEFQRQSRNFADALGNAGKLTASGMLPGRNHYEMFEELENPDSPVFRTMLGATQC